MKLEIDESQVKAATQYCWSARVKFTGRGVVQTAGGFMFLTSISRNAARTAGSRDCTDDGYAVCVH